MTTWPDYRVTGRAIALAMEHDETSVHLRSIFDLCDQDRDGVVSVEEFRELGQKHFGTAEVSTRV